MVTTVIIPARNEEATIGDIVRMFMSFPETASTTYVAVDGETTDNTAEVAHAAGAIAVPCVVHGKGEVVSRLIEALALFDETTERTILCDGDYTGLTPYHIHRLLVYKHGMCIGVPDWPEGEIPDHVTKAWPHVSGFRILPTWIIPANGHGYLLETQINKRAADNRMQVMHEFMIGLKSPFQWPMTQRRKEARELDRKWGIENGIL